MERYEIVQLPDEPDVWYFLDTVRNRAEFLRLEWHEAGRSVKVTPLNDGHAGPYWLDDSGGTWKCECLAAQNGKTCYHLLTVREAAQTEVPRIQAEFRRQATAAFLARPIGGRKPATIAH